MSFIRTTDSSLLSIILAENDTRCPISEAASNIWLKNHTGRYCSERGINTVLKWGILKHLQTGAEARGMPSESLLGAALALLNHILTRHVSPLALWLNSTWVSREAIVTLWLNCSQEQASHRGHEVMCGKTNYWSLHVSNKVSHSPILERLGPVSS